MGCGVGCGGLELMLVYTSHLTYGAIAQLGERFAGSEEVAGSSPASSIGLPSPKASSKDIATFYTPHCVKRSNRSLVNHNYSSERLGASPQSCSSL